MKKYFKIPRTLLGLIAMMSLVIGGNLTPLLASAAGASISLTANKATVSAGGSLVVAVYMNGGGSSVNGIEADVSYSAAKLQYVGVNYNGSAFEITASGSGGGGLVSLARGTTGAVTGGGLVATITFEALASSGSTSLSIASSSALATDGNAVPFSSSGVGVNFGSVAASSSVGKASATAAATADTPAPPKDTTPPVISDVKISDLSPFTATITWATNEPSNSAVDYGLDTSYGLSVSAGDQVTKHSAALSSSFLTPQTILHYHVKSTDGAGNVATSPDQTLQLPGVPVTVIVRGANGRPQAGASVTIGATTATTDAKGSVTIASALGTQKITTSYGGVTTQQSISVNKSVKPLPPYQLSLAKEPLNRWMMATISLFAVVLVLLGIDAVLFGSHFFSRLAGLHRLHPHLSPAPIQHYYQSTDNPPATVKQPLPPLPTSPNEAVETTVDSLMTQPAAASVSAPAAEPVAAAPVVTTIQIADSPATPSSVAPATPKKTTPHHKKPTAHSAKKQIKVSDTSA